MTPVNRHSVIALQFSGGKDSLACLYLLREYWEKIHVIWVNTGAAFPETLSQMEEIRALVPRFIEVKSDQPAQILKSGYPSDLVSWWDTPLGRSIDVSRTGKMQAALSCCWHNIWKPMNQAVKELGATLVIRGQRSSEERKAPIASGHVEDGIEYWFPLEDWSENDVYSYLKEIGVQFPAYYAYTNKSLDCWSCTGFLDESKFLYMKEHHPGLYAQTQVSLLGLARLARVELDKIQNCAAF